MRFIHQVTLQTGHIARQYRKDVSAEAVAALSDILDSVLTDGHPGCRANRTSGSMARITAGPWS